MKVNRYYIAQVIAPVGGHADVDGEYEKYLAINLNDEMSVKAMIIRPVLLPHIRRLDDDSLARVKLALAYGLSDPNTPFRDIFNDMLPPFDPPADARDLFVWIWEEWFPGESYEIDISQCELNDDLEEPTWTVKLRPE